MLYVSIHTLHELEASTASVVGGQISSNGFHSYASRIGSKSPASEAHTRADLWMFPFIRFTNWKQVLLILGPPTIQQVSIHTLHELEAREFHSQPRKGLTLWVSIHTLHELEASLLTDSFNPFRELQRFPFIRFTNWKQGRRMWMKKQRKSFPFIRFTNWKQD
jgi:hypothetical protein